MARLLSDGDSPLSSDTVSFQLKSWIDTAPFEDLLAMTIESCTEGAAVLSMPVLVKFAQGGGVLHGGALTALADTAVALAIKSLLPEGTVFATSELTTTFLAPVRGGRVTARATVRGPESRTLWGEATLYDDVEREVARFRCTFRIARGQGYDR